MVLKKSQLYSSLWQSSYELRGSKDAGQYKNYVPTLLFMKYVSDKAASARGSLLEVTEGASFANMVALKGESSLSPTRSSPRCCDLTITDLLPTSD